MITKSDVKIYKSISRNNHELPVCKTMEPKKYKRKKKKTSTLLHESEEEELYYENQVE